MNDRDSTNVEAAAYLAREDEDEYDDRPTRAEILADLADLEEGSWRPPPRPPATPRKAD